MVDESKSRPYTLRRRRETQEATRRRIVEATVELHRSEGPARTTITAIAQLAGVQRHTVYRHFPTEAELLAACSGHFLANHPPPDPGSWARIENPQERLRTGLEQLYSYYDANAQMITSVLRDSTVVPVGAGFRNLQAAATKALLAGHPTRLKAGAVGLATDFRAWQVLGSHSDVTPREAADLMCRMLGCL